MSNSYFIALGCSRYYSQPTHETPSPTPYRSLSVDYNSISESIGMLKSHQQQLHQHNTTTITTTTTTLIQEQQQQQQRAQRQQSLDSTLHDGFKLMPDVDYDKV